MIYVTFNLGGMSMASQTVYRIAGRHLCFVYPFKQPGYSRTEVHVNRGLASPRNRDRLTSALTVIQCSHDALHMGSC